MELTSAGLDRYLAHEAAGEPLSEVIAVIGHSLGTGVDLDDVDQHGWSRLYRVAFAGSAFPEGPVSVEALLACGADPKAGRDPLGAVVWGTDDSFNDAKARVIDLLVAAGCNLHDRDDAGRRLIDCAAAEYSHGPGYASSDGFSCTSVLQLVRHGVSVNHRSPEGLTLLHAAAVNGSATAIRELLAAGADRAARTPNGELALGLAKRSRDRSIEAIRLLS